MNHEKRTASTFLQLWCGVSEQGAEEDQLFSQQLHLGERRASWLSEISGVCDDLKWFFLILEKKIPAYLLQLTSFMWAVGTLGYMVRHDTGPWFWIMVPRGLCHRGTVPGGQRKRQIKVERCWNCHLRASISPWTRRWHQALKSFKADVSGLIFGMLPLAGPRYTSY